MGVLLLQGGLALLFALAPSFFFPSYVSSAELSALQQAISADQLAPILVNLKEQFAAPSLPLMHGAVFSLFYWG